MPRYTLTIADIADSKGRTGIKVESHHSKPVDTSNPSPAQLLGAMLASKLETILRESPGTQFLSTEYHTHECTDGRCVCPEKAKVIPLVKVKEIHE